ncbi:zinc finger CCCH domain-containing protein 19 [Striga asiatica]|uniref:Zinc finger CCCH domain-containing protein 19 n=1 Tax=Striga asiatica TaxID=4170 RepID=A0A5A7QAJ1_STRAF|nr:zinc finger CCCH domain-containing protein 19 [Striga asiatica]
MADDEDSVAGVSKPSETEMEEVTADAPAAGGAEKGESTPGLGDSSPSACGERAEAEGGEGLPENHAAEGDTEFAADTVAEMNELPAVVEAAAVEEGGGGVVALRSEDQPPETNDVEGGDVVTETPSPVVAAQVDGAQAAGEGVTEMDATPFEDQPGGAKAEEESESEMDKKVLLTDYNPQIEDARGGEMLVVPLVEVKADQDLSSVVEPNVGAADTDAGDTEQITEFQMDARKDDLQVGFEGMEVSVSKSEEHVTDGKENEATGVTCLMADSCDVESKVEVVVEGDKVHEEKEKVAVLVNDSEVETIEKPASFEDEKVDSVTLEETSVTGCEMDVEIKTEVNACVVVTGEQEQIPESSHHLNNHDEELEHAEENLTSGTTMVDESMTVEVSGVDMTETENEDAVVRENLPEVDGKEETEMGEELDLPRNVVADDTQLDDAEVGTEKGTDELADRTSDEDGKMETEETNSDADEPGPDLYDSPAALDEEEDEAMAAEEETGTQDTEMETEANIAESGKAAGGKRKRAKLSKNSLTLKGTTKASSRKTVGEDVCFICFDGGELVLCDRRGCPKAYHPSCVNRDEAFFKSKGRWNCGWHLCSICEKNARYMCYTCTFSLCKSCTKDAVILCVRGNKGFCQTCMRTVRLIENKEQGSQEAQVDFDDRNSWEYLFKDYYIELKSKLSLSLDEIAEARNPWKGADVLSGPSKQELSDARADANDGGSGSDDSIENRETIRPKRRKTRKQRKSLSREEELVSTGVDNSEWASKELLEFVSHMKDGDTSLLSQFDVQALLLEYIKRNKLRDPRRKSQIMCDARLANLFGKPRVAHFEMLKLLESHFLVRDEHNDDFQGSVVDTENNQLDDDGNGDPQAKGSKDRKRKSRRKGDRGPQSNLDDYAAIDMHNIGLIYLRRKLMEDLLEDAETFHDKVIGSFVRIRISGSNQKQDLYRLVQVVGTSKAAEPYKIGKKSTDTMVEILNLDKTEIFLFVDVWGNSEECKRLRQSIKCGLIRRLTVGEILDKTTEIQAARVNDWLESETLRLSHLRDRANFDRHVLNLSAITLRECVEKLQLLKTPEERRRRLDEIPEIHADPKMDPSYESDDNDSENEDSRRDAFMRARGINRRPRAPISPGSDSSSKLTIKNWESTKYSLGSSFSINATHVGEIVNENSSWNSESVKSTDEFGNLEKQNSSSNHEQHIERAPRSTASVMITQQSSSLSAGGAAVETAAVKINESEKIWHYQDPSGKIQGPFSMVQLRKWNNTGYFPANLKIWRSTEKQEKSILLADALEGKFPKDSPATNNNNNNTLYNSSHSSASHSVKSEISLHKERSSNLDQNLGSRARTSAEQWRGNDFTNLPSPTPRQSNSGWDVKESRALSVGTNQQNPVINGVLASPTPVSPYIGTRSPSVVASSSSIANPAIQTAPFSPTPDSQQGTTTPAVPLQHAQTGEPPVVSQLAMQVPPAHLPAGVQAQNPQGGYVWGPPANTPQNSSGSFQNSGTPPPPPPAGLQPDPWRPAAAQAPSQPNMAPLPWAGVGGPTENNAANNTNMVWPTNMVQPNNNINPNMGWGSWGPPHAVPNWGVVAPPTGNVGPNSNPGPMPGYVNPPAWGQGPIAGNGWGPPGGNNTGGPPPGPAQQGNMNQGGSWGGGSEQQQNQMGGGGQYSSGGRGGSGRDSGYRGGGPRPWNNNNRQSSFGGGGFRRKDMVCPYNKNGRCRKGVYCDYMHT